MLPGKPLDSGFNYRPTSKVKGATLSAEGRAEVLHKMASVDRARLRAAEESHTAYVG